MAVTAAHRVESSPDIATVRSESRRPRRAQAWSRHRVPIWFLFPGLAIFFTVALLPSIIGTGYSFTSFSLGARTAIFNGLTNYIQAFTDPSTLGPLLQTLVLAGVVMVFQNAIGLLLALALNTKIKSRNVLRILFFAPFVISPLVSGYLWKFMLAPDGAVNTFLGVIGLEHLEQPWLGDPVLALISIMVAVVWQFTGSSMVIYLAGLQSVPADVIEAAELDGATGPRRFWFVTRPFLAPAITVNFTLSLISGLRLYDQVVSMTGGGPGTATDTISTLIFRTAFTFGQYGYGAAMAVILTVLVLVLSIVQALGLRRQRQA